jgi:hypothetical protein
MTGDRQSVAKKNRSLRLGRGGCSQAGVSAPGVEGPRRTACRTFTLVKTQLRRGVHTVLQ